MARRKIVIERLPLIAGVLPVGIMAFQPDAKTYLLRCDEAESGVVNHEIVTQRGQVQVRRCRARQVLPTESAIGRNLLDVYRRRECVDGDVARIDDADAFVWREPQFSVHELGDMGAVAATKRMGL